MALPKTIEADEKVYQFIREQNPKGPDGMLFAGTPFTSNCRPTMTVGEWQWFCGVWHAWPRAMECLREQEAEIEQLRAKLRKKEATAP